MGQVGTFHRAYGNSELRAAPDVNLADRRPAGASFQNGPAAFTGPGGNQEVEDEADCSRFSHTDVADERDVVLEVGQEGRVALKVPSSMLDLPPQWPGLFFFVEEVFDFLERLLRGLQ